MNVLTEQDLDTLFDLLESDQLPDDVLDFHETHGLLTATVVSPTPLADEDWLALVFGEEDTPFNTQQDAELCVQLLKRLKIQIADELYSDQQVALPFDLAPGLDLIPKSDQDQSDLSAWCCGFLELVFSQQDQWFANEEAASTLLFPIELGSGLFAQEDEIKSILKKSKLAGDVIQQIPEVLVDLYLLFHAPEDKKRR